MPDVGSHFYNVYETAHGKFTSVAAIEPQFYAELSDILVELVFSPARIDELRERRVIG